MNTLTPFLSRLIAAVLLLVSCVACAPMSDIYKASSKGTVSGVERLLIDGADVNDFSPTHGTPLRGAAESGNIEMVTYLLDKGADIDLGSPLVGAAWSNHLGIATLLLTEGARVNNGGWNEDSPLDVATRNHHEEMVTLLLAAKANPDGDGRGEPLWRAAFQGYDSIVLQLLNAGANPNLRYCLEVAVRHSPNDETTKLLLEHGAEVNSRDERGWTALHTAALYGRTERVRLLLQYGARVGFKDKSGKTAELYALEQDYPKIVAMILASHNK